MTRPIVLVSRAIASTWSSSASNTSLVSAFSLSGRFSHRVAVPPLFSRRTKLFIARILFAIPPSATERLKQAGCIRVAIGLGLNQGQFRLGVRLFRVQQGRHADRPQRSLALREIKCHLG